MKERLVTGLPLAAAVILLLVYGPAWATWLLLQGGAMIVADEMWRMTAKEPLARDRWTAILVVGGLVALTYWLPEWTERYHLIAVLALLSVVLFSPGDVGPMGHRAGMLLATYAYCGILISALVAIVRPPFGPLWVLAIFAGVFGGDTGAYFAGRFLGKTKLYEKISPKKTWAGAFGGVAGSVLGFSLAASLSGLRVPAPHVVALGVGISIFEQVGDLAESMFKRAFGVKDSGRLLPGHGGLLDRIDGVLFAAPFVWIYLTTWA